MSWKVSFPLWILEVKNCLLKNLCNWQKKKLLVHSTMWLSWWNWYGVGKIHLGLHLNEEPMEGNDVDDQSTPIVKLPQACEYTQLLSNFAMEHPPKFPIIKVMNMQYFMNKLSKMSISNINKHHHKTIDSYSVVCDMVKTSSRDYISSKPHIVWQCEHNSSIECSFIPMYLHHVYKMTSYIETCHFFMEKLG